MTVEHLLVAIAKASDACTPKVAVFQPAITNATRKKNGDTVITLKLITNEFTPNDVLEGMTGWLAIGTVRRWLVKQETDYYLGLTVFTPFLKGRAFQVTDTLQKMGKIDRLSRRRGGKT